MKRTVKEQLRSLVDDWNSDLLTTDSYREARRELLGLAMSGDDLEGQVLDFTRPRKQREVPVHASEDDQITRRDARRANSNNSSETCESNDSRQVGIDQAEHRSGAAKWIGAALSLAILASAWWLWSNQMSSIESPAQVETRTSDFDSAQQVMNDFIEYGDWSSESIDQFMVRWDAISQRTRQQVKSTSHYREFARQLRDRLRDSELGDADEASQTTIALNRLAFGIDLKVESRFSGIQDVLEEQNRLAELQRQRALEQERQRRAAEIETARKREQEALAQEEQSQHVEQTNTDTSTLTTTSSEIVDEPSAQENVSAEIATEDVLGASVDIDEGIPVSKTDVPGASTNLDVNENDIPVDPMPENANLPVDATINETSEPQEAQSTPQSTSQAVALAAVDNGDSVPDAGQSGGAQKTSESKCHPSVLGQRRKYCNDMLVDGREAPKLAIVRPGEFQMGSNKRDEEQPVHTVTVTQGYALGTHEVSFKQYQMFCQSSGRSCPHNPWDDDELPVVNVTWNDALAYTQWLSQQTGAQYRLPSESEWEFATRAGTESDYPFGDSVNFANTHFRDEKRRSKPVVVDGHFVVSNSWGLKHTVGNVKEWVADNWRDTYANKSSSQQAFTAGNDGEKVVRGGAFTDRSGNVRSSSREKMASSTTAVDIGFRVLREF